MKFSVIATATAVATVITLGVGREVQGKLVFEDDLRNSTVSAGPSDPERTVEEGREEERKDLSRSEMMRRQRMREELKNEDLLTQKLEELRLKDEVKRTEEILGSGVEKQPVASSPLEEQRIGSAAIAPTGPIGIGPTGAGMQLAQVSAVSAEGAPAAQSVAVAQLSADDEKELSRVTITPRGGTSSITNSLYDVEARFSAGVGIGVEVSDHVAFEGGYTFSQYALGAGNTLYNPMVYNLQQLQLNDNVIDLGAKAYLLGPKSRVRPFVGAGVGYRKGYVNYDDRTLEFLRSSNVYDAQDVEITAFMGMVQTGLEFKVSKNIALTGMFRYFNILSARQSNPINPYAFIGNGYNGGLAGGYYGGLAGYNYGLAGGYSPNGYSAFGYNSDMRSRQADALARNNFYQLMAGISISF